jgi:hypothetical protein
MTIENKLRAEDVAARPDVQRWIKRFQRVAKDMPECLMVFVGEDNVILARTEAGDYPLRLRRGQESMDPDAVVATIEGGKWEGGAW